MSVSVIERPQRTIEAATTPDQVSKWTAVWHPVVFRFQRADYTIDDVQQVSTGLAIVVPGDATEELAVGDSIYLFIDGAYGDSYEVIDIFTTVGSPQQTYIVIDESLVSPVNITASSYVNILGRVAYFIEVRILEYTTGLPVETTTEYPRFRPDATGLIKADLQAWLQALVRARDDHDYMTLSIRDANLGQPFNIQYREYWAAVGYSDWSVLDTDNMHYIVHAAKQTGDLYGQNVGEYVMFPPDTASPPAEGSRGKFLTKFAVPVFWDGYPFSLAFIYSDEYDTEGTLYKLEQGLSANGAEVSLTQDSMPDYSGFVNRLILRGGYTTDTKNVYVTLRTANRSAYVDDGYVDLGYVDMSGAVAISESILVKVADGCVNNPEYFAWLNPAGGFDYWLFARAQDVADKVDNEQLFERYVEDLATATARDSTMVKDVQEEMVIGAEQLSRQEAEGLRHMLSSPLVLRFRGYDSTTGLPKWIRAGIKPGTFQIYKTDENKSGLVCTILPPQRYVQQQ